MSLMKVIKKTWMHGMDVIVYFLSLQLPPSFNSVTGRQCEYYIDSANIGACQTGTAEIERHETNYLPAIFHSFFFLFWWWWWYAEETYEILINTFNCLLIKRCRVIWSLYAGNWQINTVLISWFYEYSIRAYTVKECRKKKYFALAHYVI